MWKAVRENPRAVTYAVLMHVGLLLLLVFSLDWTPKVVKPGTNKPIKAELVDMTKVRELEAQKKAEQQRMADQKRKLEEEKQRKAKEESKKKADQEKQRKLEAERKKKTEQDKQHKLEAERKKKTEQEQQRKAEAEREKKTAQEKQRKAEAEQKKKAEQEKQRKAEAARQQQAEQALQAQLAEEAAQARAESALSEFIPYIQQKVQSSWLRPAGSPPGLSCVIQVKLIPGGEVVSAKVVQGSGDALFDRSVETAVLKASPLPLPDDPAIAKYFREINFVFNPG
jgi:colicin import membrane protein